MPRKSTAGRVVATGRKSSAGRAALPPGQNLISVSDNYSDGLWTKDNCTIGTDAVAGPITGSLADSIIENAVNGAHGIRFAYTAALVPLGARWTLSFYAKKSTRDFIALIGTSGAGAWFDLQTGATATVNSPYTAGIDTLGGGWYRCWMSALKSDVSTWVAWPQNVDGAFTYQGVNGQVATYIWGAQLVRASWPGTPITTTGSVVNTGAIRNKVT